MSELPAQVVIVAVTLARGSSGGVGVYSIVTSSDQDRVPGKDAVIVAPGSGAERVTRRGVPPKTPLAPSGIEGVAEMPQGASSAGSAVSADFSVEHAARTRRRDEERARMPER